MATQQTGGRVAFRRGARFLWGLMLLGSWLSPPPLWANDPPLPLFHESEAAFLRQVGEGAFDPQLELHLIEYAVDPRWAMDWAAQRYVKNGIHAEYGSTTSSRLYVHSQAALNLFLTDRLQFRYDRRTYQDLRFESQDERFEFIWYQGKAWGLVASGWPSPRKEQAGWGAGFRLGAPGGPQGITLLLMKDRPFWNGKTAESIRFERVPSRLLLDGHGRYGAWQVRGSLDLGLPYRAQDGGASPSRSVQGYQRLGDLAGEYGSETWAAGLRFSWGSLFRDQTEGGASLFKLHRSYERVLAHGRAAFGAFMGYGWLGLAQQQDHFSSSSLQSGNYRMGAVLAGLEIGIWPRENLEVRMGYLGNHGDMRRQSQPLGGAEILLPDRDERGYADKAHVRAIWSFSPHLSMEFLISHTVAGERFGGGSLKVRFIL